MGSCKSKPSPSPPKSNQEIKDCIQSYFITKFNCKYAAFEMNICDCYVKTAQKNNDETLIFVYGLIDNKEIIFTMKHAYFIQEIKKDHPESSIWYEYGPIKHYWPLFAVKFNQNKYLHISYPLTSSIQ